MIFAAQVPPANTAMGNRGRIVFFGRSENGGDPVQPHRWLLPMYRESDFGTFDRTDTVNCELFCCPDTWWIKDVPLDVNPSKTDLQDPWSDAGP